MERPEKPTWLSIEGLGLVASMIDAQAEGVRDQHETLLRARPYVLDDATVDRILKVYGDTADDLWLYDEQLALWSREALSGSQRREVERLKAQMVDHREVVEAILALAAKLRDQTIERLLATSDAEVGLEWLLGGGEGRGRR